MFPGFNYAVNAASIASTLSALNALTRVNVISTPSLMVLDNKTARLQIGDQVPIATQSAISHAKNSGLDADAAPVQFGCKSSLSERATAAAML